MENPGYHITEKELAGHAIITITHIPTGNHVSIIAGYGGAINSFVVNGKQVLISAANPEDFEAITKKAFAGVQLFPFVNRINNARYTINGNTYLLPVNDDAGFPHSLHGLIYNQPFTIAAINETAGSVALSYHFKKNATAYPFEFSLLVEYILRIDSLQVNTTITNLDNKEAPMSYGWHPYIAVTAKADDCKLQLPAAKYYLTDDRLIPNGETKELKKFIEPTVIGDLALNHCFEVMSDLDEPATTIEDTDGTCIQLTQKGFRYIHCYIPPGRKSIAIEPQTSIPDVLNNGIGLIKMRPGEALDFSFTITVQKNNI